MVGEHRRAVGVFSTRQDAEYALNELNRSGFPMDKISIIARDAARQDDIAGIDVSAGVGNKADQGAGSGAATGGILGGAAGLLVGIGALAIPGVGPVVLAGEIATTLATTLAGGAIGAAAGSLIGALLGLGIPEERAREYNERVSRGGYLVIVSGNDAEISRAEAILNGRGIQEWGIYDAPGMSTGTGLSDPIGMTPIIPATNAYDSVMPMSGLTGMGIGAPTGVEPVFGDYDTTPAAVPAGTAWSQHKRAIGVFSSHREAEHALHELRNSGFDMDKVSVVAKDADRNSDIAGLETSERVGNKADEGAATGAATGGALGGLTGLLVGLGALAIPGVGPVMLAGAAATTIATTLAGGAIGAATGGLVGALVGLGIPEAQARAYNERLSQGDYLVLVDGTDDEIHRAEAILSNGGIQDWGVYDSSEADSTRRDDAATNTPVSDTARTDYPSSVVDNAPKVTIVDRRDENMK